MKVSTSMTDDPHTLEIIECPWCGGFESHFVHIVNEPYYETVMCQHCVQLIAETILAEVERQAGSQA